MTEMWCWYDTVTACMLTWYLITPLILISPSTIMDTDSQYNSDEETLDDIFGANVEDAEETYRQVALECARIFVQVIGTTVLAFGGPLHNKTPYHTSALPGLDWAL